MTVNSLLLGCEIYVVYISLIYENYFFSGDSELVNTYVGTVFRRALLLRNVLSFQIDGWLFGSKNNNNCLREVRK